MLNASNLACNSGAYTTIRTVAFICWHSILLPCFPVFQEADGISSATHPSLNYVCSRATTAKERHPTTRLPYQNSNRSQYICNKRKRAVCKVSSDCEVRKQFGRSKSSFFYPWLEKLNQPGFTFKRCFLYTWICNCPHAKNCNTVRVRGCVLVCYQ